MIMTPKPILSPYFSYTHFATEGKLDNLVEAIEEREIDTLCLAIIEPALDGPFLDRAAAHERLSIARTAIAKLRRRGYTADLALPGILASLRVDGDSRGELRFLYRLGAQAGAGTIWIDDAALVNSPQAGPIDWLARPRLAAFNQATRRRITRSRLLKILTIDTVKKPLSTGDRSIKRDWFAHQRRTLTTLAGVIERTVRQHRGNTRLGLLAAPIHHYGPAVTPGELAIQLAGRHIPLLAQSQGFLQDNDRTAILWVAQTLAATADASRRPVKSAAIEIRGSIEVACASNFAKSAEAMQMQLNLGLLFGQPHTLLHAFDQAGTAPTEENPYLAMWENRQKLLRKLSRLLGPQPQPAGIGVILPENHPIHLSPRHQDMETYQSSNGWPGLLWRMGFPVFVTTPTGALGRLADPPPSKARTRCVHLLTGDTPRYFKHKELKLLFEQGVLLDAFAAETLQDMGQGGLLGVEVGAPLKDVQFEIFSDQGFAAPHYGYRTLLTPYLRPGDFRGLTPIAAGCRNITTLLQKGRIPNTCGATVFDNAASDQRCAVLPYSLAAADPSPLLVLQRQRHLHDLLCWLQRAPLPCHVECTPDLVPFYIPQPTRRRLILALLNVGFDWAIESRIRLGGLPRYIKRVRELSEQGELRTYPNLKLNRPPDHRYLQLTPDTAVPPMQMTLFVLD